ncbi:hypothetical protein B0J15DRAFT_514491 [Fusarium solani]|uniref:Uncharacterized protein n=1 Tax=Fusarium solani TaxID=169388 RepID=A0A9P9K3F4_FUSSL|nr:uncharacterized protein B0J15DRAFT_514491 [Fusarium solani]KAH7247707.1 hypothetical protein B0J15DRAFT_514491 [Fusarium solani]
MSSPSSDELCHDCAEYYPVVTIGAGFGGIIIAHQLKIELGIDNFRVFERQSAVGGTWWINRYPGIACDIPAPFYSLSFSQNPNWSSFYPSGPEIDAYANNVVDKHGLRDHISLNTAVISCQWDDNAKARQEHIKAYGYESVYTNEVRVACKVLVSAVGGLIELAPWPSNDPHANLRDKHIIVVGTGCSTAQLVPKLLEDEIGAASVTQLMREPPWVLPRVQPPVLGDQLWSTLAPSLCNYVPGFMQASRLVTAAATEFDFMLFGISWLSSWRRGKLQKALIGHIKGTAPEKYHDRRIYDTEWFLSMHDLRFELTTLSLTSVDETSVTLDPGNKTHASERVLGGPQLYRGTALDGFPNLFVLFGPNSFTGHSSMILGLENQANHAIQLMKPILSNNAHTIDIKHEPVVKYNNEVQQALEKTVWNSGGCSSWYITSEGHNSVSYPYSMIWQTLRFMFPTWSHWRVTWTRRGLLKQRTRAFHLGLQQPEMSQQFQLHVNHQPLVAISWK